MDPNKPTHPGLDDSKKNNSRHLDTFEVIMRTTFYFWLDKDHSDEGIIKQYRLPEVDPERQMSDDEKTRKKNLLPRKTNMSPENQWLEDVISY